MVADHEGRGTLLPRKSRTPREVVGCGQELSISHALSLTESLSEYGGVEAGGGTLLQQRARGEGDASGQAARCPSQVEGLTSAQRMNGQ